MKLIDQILIGTFWFFAFIALVFEPLYYLGCDWKYENCSASPHTIVFWVGEVWSIYGSWDPMFLDIPMWLRVMCTIEVFIFGPLYALTAYGLQHRTKWLPYVAYPFAGALFYSTVVYFTMEILEFLPGTDMLMVFLINIPWSIFPVVLCHRLMSLYAVVPLKDVHATDDKAK